jgi:pyruvate-ferredoxin/flavodoxin oxidoreductase
MTKGMHQQKLAVDSGHWPLYRYDPRLAEAGGNPLQLDSAGPKLPLEEYYYSETRYRMLKQSDPASAERLLKEAKQDIAKQWAALHSLSK